MNIKRFLVPILIIFLLTGCSSKKNMMMELHVDTGDTITLMLDTSKGHTMSFNKDNSIVSIMNDEQTVARGVFVSENSYALYYETAYTDERCKIYDTNDINGISYILYSYTDGDKQNCEYIGWITGTNTGVVFESEVLSMNEWNDLLVNKMTFGFKQTSQVNENYSYQPNIEHSNGNNVQPTQKPTPSNTEEKTDKPTTPPIATAETEKADWTTLSIKIDGAYYTYPFSYQNLKANGWDFNINDYLEEGQTEYPLEMGEYTYSTTKLNSEEYGFEPESASIYVGFKNYTEQTKNITDCDLWAIEVCGVYGSTVADKYPEIELPGGITFGASENEIIAVYGEPNERKDMDYYIQMDYDHNYSEHMTLYVYTGTGKKGEAKGLYDVELRGY